MGKGDKRSRKGKIFSHSNGKTRPTKQNRNKAAKESGKAKSK